MTSSGLSASVNAIGIHVFFRGDDKRTEGIPELPDPCFSARFL